MFIDLALGVIEECYRDNPNDAIQLFMQELPNWGNCSCFAIVFASSRMHNVIVHDCYQESLTNLWTGEIVTETPLWKVNKYLYHIINYLLFVIIVNF